MGRSTTGRALGTALCCGLLATLLVPAAATAQDVCPSPAPCFPQGRAPIPVNGAILVGASLELTIEVELAHPESREMIAGVLRKLWPGLWSWTPLEPPDPGTYFVNVHDSNGVSGSQDVTFIAADERALPVLVSAASLSQVHHEEHECCTTDEGAGEVAVACFKTLASDHLLLDPGLSSASSLAITNQYLYRYAVLDGESSPVVLPWQSRPMLPIHKVLDEYCYEVETIDLITGVATSFGDLANLCAPLGDLAEPAHEEATIPDAELASAKCPLPPNGYRTAWCMLNAARCERLLAPFDCYYYGFVCENEAFPRHRRADAGGDALGDRHLDGLIELVDRLNDAESGDSGAKGGEALDAGAAMPAARADAGGCTILRLSPWAGLNHTVALSCASLALFVRLARRRRDR